MIKRGKKLMVAMLTAAMLTTTSFNVLAADNDGWTEASKTEAAQNGKWQEWCEQWENIKNSSTQISLTPGKDASELNFAWYSKDTENKPRFKFSNSEDMSNAIELDVTSTSAVTGYMSNKATATGLTENTTYYYSYEINGEWTTPVKYTTKSADKFSFIYVGDPQIGSSSGNTATGEETEQGQDKAVRNDSFNWANTIDTALRTNPNVSFMLSAGDQIQTRDKKGEYDSATYDKNEIEYSGYLSASALKFLPVATSIGNHDALSKNYTYHFNNPNASQLGSTAAGGGYYYSYGDALFIMLNTNNKNIAEHEALIKEAINSHKDAKWRIVTVHQDIYGSGEHSNEPEVVELRYSLVPIFEENNIDVVLTGHDHVYSRSLILKGGAKDESTMLTEDEFDEYFEAELEGNTDALDEKYTNYLNSIEDNSALVDVTYENGAAVNPEGILYMTANSASGSKYYDLVTKQQSYIASRWQEDVPTYSIIDIDEVSFTINTYRTDNNEKIDNTYSIVKSVDKSNLNELIEEVEGKLLEKDKYTTESIVALEEALVTAKEVAGRANATTEEVGQAYANLNQALLALKVKEVVTPDAEDDKVNGDNNSSINDENKENTNLSTSTSKKPQSGNTTKTGDDREIFKVLSTAVGSIVVLGVITYIMTRKKEAK